jgi:DNA-binding FadR family transcriptional regulator
MSLPGTFRGMRNKRLVIKMNDSEAVAVVSEDNGSEKTGSVVDTVFTEILDRIESGKWPVGFSIPSERALMQEFGVSRIALREAILRLRTLGVLHVSQGKRSTVERMDTSILRHLIPLMLSLDGEKTFNQIFEVRLSLEADTAFLAAKNRTQKDIAEIFEIVDDMRELAPEAKDEWVELDLKMHKAIAAATKNPLYELLIDTLSMFIAKYVQDVDQGLATHRDRARFFHESMAEAIRDGDGEHARALMQSHLMASAGHLRKRDLLEV